MHRATFDAPSSFDPRRLVARAPPASTPPQRDGRHRCCLGAPKIAPSNATARGRREKAAPDSLCRLLSKRPWAGLRRPIRPTARRSREGLGNRVFSRPFFLRLLFGRLLALPTPFACRAIRPISAGMGASPASRSHSHPKPCSIDNAKGPARTKALVFAVRGFLPPKN